MLLCRLNEIEPNASRGFEVEGVSLFCVRKDEQVFAYINHCPHRGVPLEWQPDTFLDAEKQFIQCATHGALFTIDAGECVAGPCPGEKLTPVGVRLEAGDIHVDL